MDLHKLYSVDEKAANEGKWLVTKEGLDVKVAKLGNPAFVAEVARLQKPHVVRLRSNMDNTELLNEITIKAMAKTILLDWKAESDGEPVPYTPELGYQYMVMFPDFREDVSDLSVSRNNFKPEDVAGK
jgi:hypothetical protein